MSGSGVEAQVTWRPVAADVAALDGTVHADEAGLLEPVGSEGLAGAGSSGPASWAERHPLAAALEAMVPGLALVEVLSGCEPADVDDAAVVELVGGWERIASWAAAGQAVALAELGRRRLGERAEFVGDEVAARLCVTRAVAEAKVGFALGLDRVPAVADALAAGEVDVRRASVLVDELARVPEQVAQDVAGAVLGQGVQCTAPVLRQRLRRLELLRDPEGAVVRHRRACERRRVELTPAGDAMAWLAAYLPATDAVAVQTTLTALARDLSPEEGDRFDARTLDQRRADALVDLATRWLDAGVHPEGRPLRTVQGRAPHLTLTATAATVLGLEDQPGTLEGYGVIPANLVRRLAARSTWEPLLVAAGTGEPLARSTRRYAPTQALREAVSARDRTCTFPGCRIPATRCDIDHIEAYRADDPPQGAARGPQDRGRPRGSREDDGGPQTGHDADEPDQTRLENLHALCRHHHRAKTHAGWTPERHPDGTTTWTTPTGHQHQRPPAWPDPDPPPPPDPDPGWTETPPGGVPPGDADTVDAPSVPQPWPDEPPF